ncbi:hypothetical protein PM082_012626 [Marasmius tenuissimus]|nr:hypothetical protein PM082_012626 [Marasmius tenuissimus]
MCVAHLNRLPLDYFDSTTPTSTSLACDDDGGNGSAADEGETDASPIGPSASTKERRGDERHEDDDPGALSSGPPGFSLIPSLQEIQGDGKPGGGVKLGGRAASNSDYLKRRLADCLIGD